MIFFHDNHSFKNHLLRLALCLATSLSAIPAFSSSKTCDTWAKVCNYINDYDIISFRPSNAAGRSIGKTLYVSSKVTLDLNIRAERNTSNTAIVVRNGGNLTLTGSYINGYNNSGAPLIVVEKGGKLTLSCGLINAQLSGARDGAAIFVQAGGELVMNTGAYIDDCYSELGSGAAVCNEGTFTMNAGYIVGCVGYSTNAAGGAVRNQGNGVFTMNGGTIGDCYCINNNTIGGAVYNGKTATFVMNGGTITSCKANKGGGVYNSGTFWLKGNAVIESCSTHTGNNGGGGVYNDGTFYMRGTSVIRTCSQGGGVATCGTTDIYGDGGACWITQNNDFYGGGLHIFGGTTTISNCNIYQNTGDAGSQIASVNLFGGNGGTLNLSNCNIDASVNSARGAVFIQSSGTVNMTGGDIKNSYATEDYGGAVTIYSGTFNMSGGWIGNCTSKGSAGAIKIYSGTVNMSGGEIRNCSATSCGGAIYVAQGDSKFIMSGGTIHDNTAGSGGGGVFEAYCKEVTLSGGSIYSNKASYGGGLRLSNGTVTLSGTKIYSNRAKGNGNGIQMDGAVTLNMTGGEIYGNYDEGGCSYGGSGILAWTNTKVNISGGSIYNNTTAGQGGAIYMGQNSRVTVTGGTISGNKSTGSGIGGIYFNSSDSLKFGGGAKVTGNLLANGTSAGNIYVPSGKYVSVMASPAFADDASVGITTQGLPTTSSQVEFSQVCNESDKNHFFADNSIYTTIFNSSNKLELGGYLLTIDAKGGTGTVKNVRTIKGQPCPTLPSLTKTGNFMLGWYTQDQPSESSPLPQDSYKVESGQNINFSAEKTAYAWWKSIASESTDAAGHTEVINKPQVSTEDIAYVLEHSGSGNTVAAVDMSSSKGVDNPTELIDLIHNSTRTTPNTLIFFPDGVSVPKDRAQNVVIKQVSGKDTTYKCVDFSVTDGYSVKVNKTFSADAATYNRSMSGRWGTVCVPYELKSDERVQFYTSGSLKGDMLVLEKSATVPAGHGAIYQVYDIDAEGEQGETLGKKDFTKTDLVKVVESSPATPTAAVKVQGQFTELKVDDAKAASEFSGYDLYYYKDNKFYKRTAGQTVTIPALRAYILISKAAPSSLKTKFYSIIGK